MKVIDLLNKIANGEEVPKKIKFKNNIYKWIERNDNVFNYKQEYKGRLIDNYLCDDWFMDSESILNDEVEIIEEDNKIENINLAYIDKEYLIDKEDVDKKINEIINRHNILVDKTKEIIDKLNEVLNERN